MHLTRLCAPVLALAVLACEATTEPAAHPSAAVAAAIPAGQQDGTAPLQRQLSAARSATARYHRLEAALADGYVDIDVFMPGMGHHYLKPALLDGTFDAARPELLVYADQPGGLRLVAVEYAVPLALADRPPEGFAGTSDGWDRNERFQLWTLHAWIWRHNPDGMFASHNPRLR